MRWRIPAILTWNCHCLMKGKDRCKVHGLKTKRRKPSPQVRSESK